MSFPCPRWTAALLVAILVGCSPSTSEHHAVTQENEKLRNEVDRLEGRIAELAGRIEELESARDGSLVSLSNTELHRLTSESNGETYEIKVWLPRGYPESRQRLPVLYVIDAETNFGFVSYIVQRLIKDQLIPEMLVVGIAYGSYERFYELRGRDLTPTVDPSFRRGQPSGGAGAFSTFFETQVFPMIAETYRVDEDQRAIYGHSFGGLFGFYALLRAPHLFDRYLLLSSSLWWDQEVLFGWIEQDLPASRRPSRLFVASGELEPRIDEMQLEFVSQLAAREPTTLEIQSEVFPNETHRTIFGRGFTNGLRFLFSNTVP